MFTAVMAEFSAEKPLWLKCTKCEWSRIKVSSVFSFPSPLPALISEDTYSVTLDSGKHGMMDTMSDTEDSCKNLCPPS